MLRFQKTYFFIALLLFLSLVFIAMYVRDSFIRPYGGDLLVVIFLYCLIRIFFRIPVKKAVFGVLLFAFFIEGLQYLELIRRLELENNAVAVAVLGSHFEWLDLLLYSVGAILIFGFENIKKPNS
ncbi:Protein of unknown function [Salinimicrobium catena]|uniref:DUF2809 domain-containing protein n=1 Tax=Salinimicrobium catena TaxID=390640 RepID=A0A1H5IR70_9FLAO|nr:DUF2809 domain-containing protein [Salinimicrobium catena]SDK79571.1 Protein of unknown function [Salinimicrobium catena]SEE42371.1 Protein of unknown function [Salinimicrobium catena]